MPSTSGPLGGPALASAGEPACAPGARSVAASATITQKTANRHKRSRLRMGVPPTTVSSSAGNLVLALETCGTARCQGPLPTALLSGLSWPGTPVEYGPGKLLICHLSRSRYRAHDAGVDGSNPSFLTEPMYRSAC